MIRRSSGRATPLARPARPSALRPGARPGGGVRRTKPVRRASAGLTPVRAGALLAILVAIAGLYGLASSNAFALRRTTIIGATWTPQSTILAALALPEGANVFTVHAGDLERLVRAIPSLRGASVEVSLPDEVRVAVAERQPLLVWRANGTSYLVDGEGSLFEQVTPDNAEAAATLPLIDDARSDAASLAVGSVLDDVTLDAALRLASLRPADVGSAARSLVLRLDDTDGFTMRTEPASWTAVFGFYTPTLRTTDLVPGQVRLLRSILAGQEATIQRVILADDRSGTILPRDTPAPSGSAKPDRSPKPARTPKPTAAPTAKPTAAPTAKPGAAPTSKPSAAPTRTRAAQPSGSPTP